MPSVEGVALTRSSTALTHAIVLQGDDARPTHDRTIRAARRHDVLAAHGERHRPPQSRAPAGECCEGHRERSRATPARTVLSLLRGTRLALPRAEGLPPHARC